MSFEGQSVTIHSQIMPRLALSLLICQVVAHLAGCATSSSANTRLEPRPTEGQKILFERGQPQLQAEGSHPVRMTVVDHAGDQMVVHISVENRSTTTYLFSHEALSGEMVTRSGAHPITVYGYEEVLELLDDSDEKMAAKAGSTAISVGSGAVPYGGTLGTIAQYVLAASVSDEGDPEARLDKVTQAAMATAYIRPNTMPPGSQYEGILRVALPEPLGNCRSLRFEVRVDEVRHGFIFDCRAAAG